MKGLKTKWYVSYERTPCLLKLLAASRLGGSSLPLAVFGCAPWWSIFCTKAGPLTRLPPQGLRITSARSLVLLDTFPTWINTSLLQLANHRNKTYSSFAGSGVAAVRKSDLRLVWCCRNRNYLPTPIVNTRPGYATNESWPIITCAQTYLPKTLITTLAELQTADVAVCSWEQRENKVTPRSKLRTHPT